MYPLVRVALMWRLLRRGYFVLIPNDPTTQAAGTPAASAAGNIVVATSATTGGSLASTSVVTSTVTTQSSPKRTMPLGDYKKTRGNMVLARDELEALFDVGSDADMENGEEEDEVPSSSTRVDPTVGSRQPCEDGSDASSSKRSRSGSDRPLADAGAMSSPRSGGDSTSSGTVVSCTGPVGDPSMPTPSEIHTRFGSTAPPSQYALYSCSGINDDDATKELDFDPPMNQRRDYYIGLFHELRWYRNKKTSRRSMVPEWQALCQSWGAFVENFNKDPAGYCERVRLTRERYERFSKRPKIDRLHWVQSKRELKALRTTLIAQMSSSATGECGTLPRAVGDISSRSSFTPFGGFGGGGLRTLSPFPERPASGRSVAPTYRGSGISSPTNMKMIWTQGPDPTINTSLDDPASCPLCVSQWGWSRQEDAAGLVRQTPLIVWRLLNASRG
ncbi:unnamed protein product [Phytophthora fragariaefolia]|uniref:Unnamed protein product n=1 Tax=Phytophthora fragariaefolia TaxID=1490495 RepID=A0A9W6YHG6_9STRA|nr:unnamed protein product [Phytophthora fragariaefolia]